MPVVEEIEPEIAHPMAGTVRLVLRGYEAGSEVINTFYFKYNVSLTPDAAALISLATRWWTNVGTIYRSLLTSAWQVSDITVTDLGHLTGTQGVYVPSTAVGTQGTEPANGNTSLGMRRKTDLAGRSGRGRIMLPPFDRTLWSRDIVNNTLIPRLVSLASVLLDTYVIAGSDSWKPSAGSTKLVSSRVILAWVFDLIADSMKSRLTGHGA